MASGRGCAPPVLPVSVRRCESYHPAEVLRSLATALDDIGGLRPLVAGKSVAIKANLTGRPEVGCLSRPAGQTYRVHPNVALALAHLLAGAGARRISFLDGVMSPGSLREFVGRDGWDLDALDALGIPVVLLNTRNLAGARDYVHCHVRGGGWLFPSYWIHPAYLDCDVFVSLAKMKNHGNAGLTLSAKNLFGMIPAALYGGSSHDERRVGIRTVVHATSTRPPAGLPGQVANAGAYVEDQRVACHIVDALAIRPVDLAIIDGISTVSGGEGPWSPELHFQRPRLLVVGRDPVSSDAVAATCMGYNPAAPHGTGPFPAYNHLRIAAEAGLGRVDLPDADLRGLVLDAARHNFGWTPPVRSTPPTENRT